MLFLNIFLLMYTSHLLVHAVTETTQYSLEVPEYPEEDEWDRDVYTCRHFDDLILPSTYASDVVTHAVVLVLYTPDCVDGGEDLHYSSLPPQSYLYYSKHDWVTTPRHMPFPLQESDSLFHRYRPSTCPAALYFSNGSSIYTPEVWNASEITFNNWIWDKFRLRINILNSASGSVSIGLSGPGPNFDTVVLHPGESVELDVYVSYLLTATMFVGEVLEPRFLLGRELGHHDNNTNIVLESEMGGDTSEGEWLMTSQALIWHRDHVIRMQHFNLAEIHLRNFKQATLLPKFTNYGWEKRQMPDGLQEALLKHYNHSVRNREAEQWELFPLINDNEVKCTFVPISDELRDLMFTVLQPIAETWCGQNLRPTAIYGIREYHKGNILRHHVDRPETHVISVSLPVFIDDAGRTWPLRALSHQGEEINVTLDMGEMLLYESASLIHGRPDPFQGHLYSMAYVHFQPAFDWFWTEQVAGKHNKRFLVSGKKYEFIEPLFIFATESTKRKYIKFEDEL